MKQWQNFTVNINKYIKALLHVLMCFEIFSFDEKISKIKHFVIMFNIHKNRIEIEASKGYETHAFLSEPLW